MNEDDDLLLSDEDDNEISSGSDLTNPWVILITDDSEDVHASTKFALGHQTIHGRPLTFLDAYTGKDAMGMIRDNVHVDLMLLDAVMETDDAGLRCAEYIKVDLKRKIPTIVMRTGFAGWEIEISGHNLFYIDDFLLKSNSSLERLIEILEKWLPKN